MICSVYSFSVTGIEASVIKVEADVSGGLPGIDLVGYLAGEVRESRERVRVAMKNSGFHVPAKRITINLSPADERKGGTGYDLPMALSMLVCMEEIAPEGVDKGRSLLRLAAHLGLSRSEVMAFGDGQNDVPMLEYAGYGYAMANACPQALACTDLIAPPNTEDGVAQVIEKYLAEGMIGPLR